MCIYHMLCQSGGCPSQGNLFSNNRCHSWSFDSTRRSEDAGCSVAVMLPASVGGPPWRNAVTEVYSGCQTGETVSCVFCFV